MPAILLWLLLVVARVSSVNAGLNLNFRSKQLSNIIGNKESSPPEQNEAKKESPDLLRLDLSGRLQILLAGNQQEEESPIRVTRPLLPLKVGKTLSNRFVPKRVNFAVDYDFARSLWGIIRLVPEAVWEVSHGSGKYFLYSPHQVGVSILQGVAPGIENALETQVRWTNPWHQSTDARESALLRMRCQDTGLASISCSVPLHPRVSYEGALSKNLWGPPTTLPLPGATTRQQDWWLPDICINALGAMQAHNQVWMGRTSARRLGFRLSVRKQLEWSILSSPVEQDSKTHISLQVEGATSQWRTGVRLESTLDEPLAQARVAISTRWHMSRSGESESE
eukprot:scaffold7485_cov176-Amphora_coffeaeformis.AAC.2